LATPWKVHPIEPLRNFPPEPGEISLDDWRERALEMRDEARWVLAAERRARAAAAPIEEIVVTAPKPHTPLPPFPAFQNYQPILDPEFPMAEDPRSEEDVSWLMLLDIAKQAGVDVTRDEDGKFNYEGRKVEDLAGERNQSANQFLSDVFTTRVFPQIAHQNGRGPSVTGVRTDPSNPHDVTFTYGYEGGNGGGFRSFSGDGGEMILPDRNANPSFTSPGGGGGGEPAGTSDATGTAGGRAGWDQAATQVLDALTPDMIYSMNVDQLKSLKSNLTTHAIIAGVGSLGTATLGAIPTPATPYLMGTSLVFGLTAGELAWVVKQIDDRIDELENGN